MRSISWVFFTVLLLCTNLWLLFDKLSAPEPAPMQPDVIARQDSISRISAEINQQLIANQAELRKERDSALHKLNRVEAALEKSEINTRTLAIKIKQPGRKDTVKIVEDCNELVDTAIALAERSEEYRQAGAKLQAKNDSMQTMYERRLDQQANFISQMRQNFNDLNGAYQEQGKQLQKSQKKANKHYTIGIGIGGGITTEGKPAGMVGVFITRTAFRL